MGRTWDPAQVAAELGELTLGVAAVDVETDEYDEGTIIGQAPAARSLQRGGITVTVGVAVEPELPTIIAMPDVVGLSEAKPEASWPRPDWAWRCTSNRSSTRRRNASAVIPRRVAAVAGAGGRVESGRAVEIWVNTER